MPATPPPEPSDDHPPTHGASRPRQPEIPEELMTAMQDFLTIQREGDVREEEAQAGGLLAVMRQFLESEGIELESELERAQGQAEAAHDWEKAVELQRQILEAKKATAPKAVATLPATALGGLLLALGRVEEAWETAVEALALASEDSCCLPSLEPRRFAASVALRQGRLDDALAHADAGIQAVNEEKDPPLQNPDRMSLRLRLVRAECLAQLGRLVEADEELAAVWPLIAPYAESACLAGMRAALAEYWTTTALIRRRRGNDQGALQALEQVFHHRTAIVAAPQVERHWSLYGLAKAHLRFAQYARGLQPEEASAAEQRANQTFVHLGLPVPPVT